MPFIGYIPFFVGLAVSLGAQLLVSLTFRRYSRLPAASAYSGFSAARRLLDNQGLSGVAIEQTGGNLSDHYDPRRKILRLSQSTYAATSVAAIGVAAHETGHAVQDRDHFIFNRIRSALLLPANIGSMAGPYLAGLGFVLDGLWSRLLIQIGIGLFAASVLFYLITLPVEFDASRRAVRMLEDTGILGAEELKGARKVLRAAALTYVASAAVSVLYFFRLSGMASSRNRR